MKNIIDKINFIKVTVTFAFVFSGITNLYAQIEEEIDEPVSWYQIELIIFEYTNTRNIETEIWQQHPGKPELDLALELMDSRTMLEKSIIPDPYLLLGTEEFQLGKEYNLLKSSPQRNPVLHIAWRQPGNSKGESIPIRIHGGKLYSIEQEPDETSASDNTTSFGNFLGSILADDRAEKKINAIKDKSETNAIKAENLLEQIDGTIRISRARYLHVWADLVYRVPSADIANISYDTDSQNNYSANSYSNGTDGLNTNSTSFEPVDSNSQNTPGQALASFRLQDHRRMRSRELHYIDHPLFGVIITAIPYELPELPVNEQPTEETNLPEEKGTEQSTQTLKTGKIRSYKSIQ